MRGWTKTWISPVGERQGAIVERIAAARGIARADLAAFLAPTWKDLRPTKELCGAHEVAARLVCAVREGKQIAVFGDYDADGMCASAILLHFIRAVSDGNLPRVYIPQRATESYGLSNKALGHLASLGVQVVVTVDCGITAIDEALEARRLGLELLITDHHAVLPNGALPDAAAIAHPALGGNASALCGAAVAWKVAWAFAVAWCESEKVSTMFQELLVETLALAACATITDVVALSGEAGRENRAIVRLGSARVAMSGLPGLRALAREAGIGPNDFVDEERISFGIGPIINACGRLGDPLDAVKLLGLHTTDRSEQGGTLASKFARLNLDRKQRERLIVNAATARIEEGLGTTRGACVLADSNWQRGIVGIACARLSDTLNVPVVLLERDGEFAYGSARSVAGYSVLDGLHSCKHLLERYGGHAAAAGIQVRADRIGELREGLSAHAAANRLSAEAIPLAADVALSGADLSVESFESIALLGPFGQGFPAPILLVRGAIVTKEGGVFGAERDHLSFHVRLTDAKSTRQEVRCTWWRQAAQAARIGVGMTLHLLVRPQIDRWRGTPRPAFTILDVSDESWPQS